MEFVTEVRSYVDFEEFLSPVVTIVFVLINVYTFFKTNTIILK